MIKRQYFPRPSRIVDKGVLGLWGEFDVRDTSGIPDWGTFLVPDVDVGAPPGFTRYRSRLWNISGDWKTAASQTPAVINGQYFDSPTIIRDLSVLGLYGDFDVSDAGSPLPVSPAVMAPGPNGYCYCMCNSTAGMPQGNVTLVNLASTIAVAPGTPYLYAVLTKDDDSVDVPAGAYMTIQGPDGTSYDHDVQTGSLLVVMAGDSVRCLIVKDPTPGDWTMTMQVPPGGGFHCECNTVPSQDIFDTVTGTLQKRGLASTAVGLDVVGFGGLASIAYLSVTAIPPGLLVAGVGAFLAIAAGLYTVSQYSALSPNDQAQAAKAITTATTAAYNQGGIKQAAQAAAAIASSTSTKRKKRVRNYVYAVVHDGTGRFLMATKNQRAYFYSSNGSGTVIPGGQAPNGAGKQALPGGELEQSELSLAGACREFYEETGVRLCGTDTVGFNLNPGEFAEEYQPGGYYYAVFFDVGSATLDQLQNQIAANLVIANGAAQAIAARTITNYRDLPPQCPMDNELASIAIWNINDPNTRNTVNSWANDTDLSWFRNILQRL